MLELIAEKQKQLDMLIAVEEIAANIPKPFMDFMCHLFAKFEKAKARENGNTDNDLLWEINRKAQREFLVFIISTKGQTWEQAQDKRPVPFDYALIEDESNPKICYSSESLALFKAVWIDFMILVLEDEILELMEDESLEAESSGSS